MECLLAGSSDFLESCHCCELCQATQWRLQEVAAAAGRDSVTLGLSQISCPPSLASSLYAKLNQAKICISELHGQTWEWY